MKKRLSNNMFVFCLFLLFLFIPLSLASQEKGNTKAASKGVSKAVPIKKCLATSKERVWPDWFNLSLPTLCWGISEDNFKSIVWKFHDRTKNKSFEWAAPKVSSRSINEIPLSDIQVKERFVNAGIGNVTVYSYQGKALSSKASPLSRLYCSIPKGPKLPEAENHLYFIFINGGLETVIFQFTCSCNQDEKKCGDPEIYNSLWLKMVKNYARKYSAVCKVKEESISKEFGVSPKNYKWCSMPEKNRKTISAFLSNPSPLKRTYFARFTFINSKSELGKAYVNNTFPFDKTKEKLID